MNKPVLKWSPSHPVRARDNLISAAAIEKNQLGFKPTYEAREDSTRRTSTVGEETIKEESKIKRRVVQRMMTYRKPMKNDFIDDFIQKKKGNKEAQIQMALTPEKMKYKPECYRRKGSENKAEPAKEIAAEVGTQDVKKQKEVEAQKHGKQEGIKQEKRGQTTKAA
ncbi:hypothetical protein NQ318_020136 [Aromia moschata]|uniref:Uncharacterized protein n=1 Tax=Aromia moschata TaxID=1265417 RepID=A0AAV8ZBZ0_9CUCU|nr:hypothetical protein NQ318_020136 [Aromia moschata]